MAVLVAACARAAPVATALPPAMGIPFSVDGYTITLSSLQPIRDLDPTVSLLPGYEIWILGVEMENHTGHEASVGSGFRVKDGNGEITTGAFVSPIHPDLSARLADGGKTTGNIAFSMAASSPPVVVLVEPDRTALEIGLSELPFP